MFEELNGPKGGELARIQTKLGATHCVIRKDAWPFYRIISDVRLYWVLEEPKGPKGEQHTPRTARQMLVVVCVGLVVVP